jgi:hypothetical protein
MQGIAALRVPAGACNDHCPHIPPGAGIDGLVEAQVLSLLMAVGRSVGRHAHTLWCVRARGINCPTVLWIRDIDFLPELVVLSFVFNIDVVDVKTTYI